MNTAIASSKTFSRITNCPIRTYHHFEEMINRAKTEGFEIGGFGKIESLKKSNKAVILRHDIDFSPKHALKLAGLEDILQVSATYFISLHRPHYSPLTSEMRKTIHALIDHGHEIGLHYEPEFDNLEAEIGLLEHYLDCKLVAIARHNPFGNHIDIDASSKPTDVIDAYSDEIMKNFKYLSDSSGIWREGCFCGWLEKSQKTKYQILIHPEWWDSLTIDPVEQLKKINTDWTSEHMRQATLSVDNLILHREKIEKGEA